MLLIRVLVLTLTHLCAAEPFIFIFTFTFIFILIVPSSLFPLPPPPLSTAVLYFFFPPPLQISSHQPTVNPTTQQPNSPILQFVFFSWISQSLPKWPNKMPCRRTFRSRYFIACA